MLEMDAEQTEALRLELHQLEFDEQRTRDQELSQLHDDAIHHDNDLTDQIIASFEHHSSSDDYNGFGASPVHDFNRA